jgi:hypothetical protein
MLSRLFKRKPQTTDANPARRREALLALGDSEQAVLEEAARTDADTGVRNAAVARLQSIATLGSLLDDAEVASAAASRLAQLGDDHAFAAHPLVLVARFVLQPSPDLLSMIDEGQLGTAIAGLRDVQTRVAMVREIRGEDRLTALEHVLRSGDKTVHRVVRDRLNDLKRLKHERGELVARAEALIDSASRMSVGDPQFDAKREALRDEWDALVTSLAENEEGLEASGGAAETPPDLESRFQLPESSATMTVDSFSGLLTEADALQQTIAEAPDTVDGVAELEDRWRNIGTRWGAVAEESPATGETASTFGRYREDIADLIAALDRAVSCRREIEEIANAHAGLEMPLDDDYDSRWQLQSLARRHARTAGSLRAKIAWPQGSSPPPWVAELAVAREAFEAVDENCRDAYAVVQEEIAKSISALEQAVEAGEVNEALRMQSEANRWIRRLPKSSQQRPSAKLASSARPLRELADWQAFALRGKREALCEEIEHLADHPLNPNAQMERIKTLRGRVKALGRIQSARDRALQERFDEAAERAFAPCRRHFEQLAEERKFNLEQRRAICSQLEAFAEENDWEHTDYRGVEQILRQAREEWRTYRPVDRSPGRRMDSRFKAITDRIAGHLRGEWERNEATKKAIVEQARAAVDAGAPIHEQTQLMKKLQSDWKRVGPTRRRIDQGIWKEFRGICDEVFATRDASRQERRSRLAQAVDEANALTEDLTQAIADAASVEEARRLLNACRARIEALEALPREVERRALRALSDHEREIGLRAAQQRLRAELERVDRIDGLDASLADIERGDGSKETWLEEAGELAEMFRPRLDDKPSLDLTTLRRLAVEAEIGAGISSPPEDQSLRMEVQVGRLQSGLASRDRDLADFESLLERWCAAATLQTGAEPLRARFFEAVRQIVEH